MIKAPRHLFFEDQRAKSLQNQENHPHPMTCLNFSEVDALREHINERTVNVNQYQTQQSGIYTQQSLYVNKQTQNNGCQKCGFNEDTTRHRARDFTLCMCCAGQLHRGIDSGSDTDQHCKKKKTKTQKKSSWRWVKWM